VTSFAILRFISSQIFALLITVAAGKKPLRSVQISLRGKNYKLRGITTVSELQQRLFELSGQDGALEGTIEYRGKKLSGGDVLRDVGVKDGAKLTFLPGNLQKKNNDTGGSSRSSSSWANDSNKGDASSRPWGSPKSFRELAKEDFSVTNALRFFQALNREELGALLRENLEQGYNFIRKGFNDPKARAIFQKLSVGPDEIERIRKHLLEDESIVETIGTMPEIGHILTSPEEFRELMDGMFGMAEHICEVLLDTMLDVVVDVLCGSAIRLAEQPPASAASASPDAKQAFYSFDSGQDAGSYASSVLFELSDSDEDGY